MRRLVAIVLLLVTRTAFAQQPLPAETPGEPQPPRFEDQIDVVAITPIHGMGLAVRLVPSNIQVFRAGDLRGALDVSTALAQRAASVHLSEPQASMFQPDLLFRGFVGSPLLGASQGLTVYLDGVRVNEPFGDTIGMDALPSNALASINLMPGSNPLFGLNALGGAVSMRTKDGFAYPGRRVLATTGSFGRHHVEAESGGHGNDFGYFVAGALTHESGWRDFSPSTLRRVFADMAWRGALSSVNVSVSAASNDLTGNGTSPIALLDLDRRAVFTHPDATDNDVALVTFRARRQSTPSRHFEGVAYFRHSRIATFNGDALDDDDDDDEDELAFDAVNNVSRTGTRSGGASAQMTHAATMLGRTNHLIVGGGLDVASIEFDFASEWATLTPVRGTIGSGLFDEDAFVDLHSRAATGSAFVTDTWSLTPSLAVTASARFNWTRLRLRDGIGTALTGDHTFGRVNPAAGVTYQANDWVNLFGGYSQSSRVPTPVELTCADPEDPCRLPNAFVADPPLEQVVARTWEGGVRAGNGALRGTVTVFSTAATDDIIFVSSGTLRGEGHFENVARTTRRGLETSVAFDTARVSMFAAYTRQAARFGTNFVAASRNHPDAVDRETFVASGSRLPGVPAHSGKVGADLQVTSRFSAGGVLRAQSGQFLRGDEANLLQPLPGFAVVNAQARHRLTERVVIVGQLHNLFDARYYTFGVLGEDELIDPQRDDPRFYGPGAPRAGWIGMEVTF